MIRTGTSFRGMRVIALCIALFGDAGCNGEPRAKPTPFPASDEVAGWVKTGDIRTFAAADLWKYIDGEAERYLRAGVQTTSTADYRFQNKLDAVVDIYTMGNAEGARKVFESEPAGNANSVSLGGGARLSRQSLIFCQGRHLVRIVAYEELTETQQALLQLGHGIEERLAK